MADTKPYNAHLWKELAAMTLLSVGLYAVLFLLMQTAEWLWAARFGGKLLQWSSPAFCIGVPASVLGTAYVLTVRNPQNYTGFYLGILMSVLLAVQCLLQGQPDLFVLYIFVFIPFLAMSLLKWRKAVLSGQQEDFVPAFLDRRRQALTLSAALLVIIIDYVLATFLFSDPSHRGDWLFNFMPKLLGGIMIAASLVANFWMIYKKNDAWVAWIVYCLAGLLMFTILGNVFSMLLFLVMLAVNVNAFAAWLRLSGSGKN